eukprot:gene30462-38078_t
MGEWTVAGRPWLRQLAARMAAAGGSESIFSLVEQDDPGAAAAKPGCMQQVQECLAEVATGRCERVDLRRCLSGVLEMLTMMSDFDAFKAMMLEHKEEREGFGADMPAEAQSAGITEAASAGADETFSVGSDDDVNLEEVSPQSAGITEAVADGSTSLEQMKHKLEEYIASEAFVALRREFCSAHCDYFEDDGEEKLEYTEAHWEYESSVNDAMERHFSRTGMEFDMLEFTTMVAAHPETMDPGLLEVMSTMSEFEAFKAMVLEFKQGRGMRPSDRLGAGPDAAISATERERRLQDAKDVRAGIHQHIVLAAVQRQGPSGPGRRPGAPRPAEPGPEQFAAWFKEEDLRGLRQAVRGLQSLLPDRRAEASLPPSPQALDALDVVEYVGESAVERLRAAAEYLYRIAQERKCHVRAVQDEWLTEPSARQAAAATCAGQASTGPQQGPQADHQEEALDLSVELAVDAGRRGSLLVWQIRLNVSPVY